MIIEGEKSEYSPEWGSLVEVKFDNFKPVQPCKGQPDGDNRRLQPLYCRLGICHYP